MPQLIARDFAQMFGCLEHDFSTEAQTIIQSHDFSFDGRIAAQQQQIIQRITEGLQSQIFDRTSDQNIAKWERGWQQNHEEFVQSGNLESLRPYFIRRHEHCRLFQQFIWPVDRDFEWNVLKVYRQFLFDRYISQTTQVYEFGCGPGYWLADFAQKAPEKIYIGLDWAESSQRLLRAVQAHYPAWRFSGARFDMRRPDYAVRLQKNSVVFTNGAMEQLGADSQPFLEYLRSSPVSLVFHCEPIIEWYDESPIDQLAKTFHRQRGYWEGGLPLLNQWHAERKIQLLEARRIWFGGRLQEGYSLVVWRPMTA